MLKLRQKGDTIIEVLIAMAVISAMLMAAFGLVQRTSRTVQSTKEHAEAQQLLEGQIEKLRASAASIPSGLTSVFGQTEVFCFDTGTGSLIKFSDTNPPMVTSVPTDLSKFPNGTTPDHNCIDGQAGLYHFGIEPKTIDNVFKAVVVWDSLVSGQSREEIVYKVL